MDKLSKAECSVFMVGIRGDDLRPETAIRHELRLLGTRFRSSDKRLPGSPDVAVREARLAVFVHGCFWHGCPEHYRRSKSNKAFWDAKLEANRKGNARTRRRLNRMGWGTMTVWEHEAKTDAAGAAARIARRADVRLCL